MDNRPCARVNIVIHDFLRLPIRSYYRTGRLVQQCRHLETEKPDRSIFLLSDKCARAVIENVGVLEVVTAKATEDHNLIIVDRNAAATLSHRELIYPNSDSNPISLCALTHRVESLNRIEILFAFA